MDDAERLIAAFRTRGTASVRSKLDTLVKLVRLRDPRILPFLVEVLADQRESSAVRNEVLKQLRCPRVTHGRRPAVAKAILQVLADRSRPEVRMHAAQVLGEFTDMDTVPTTLASLALDRSEPIDIRYLAFTSLQRAGPTLECVALLRQLSTDETLGSAASNLLCLWRVE